MDINLVTHIISGALNELSLYITKTSPINKKDLYTAISKLLKGFKIESNYTISAILETKLNSINNFNYSRNDKI